MNPEALVHLELDSGVPAGLLLLAFADSVIGPDLAALESARRALRGALGPEAVAGAAAIGSIFTKNDRIANGLGMPVDVMVLKATEDIRTLLDLNSFGSAVNTFKHTQA